jgi:hypothetical protein
VVVNYGIAYVAYHDTGEEKPVRRAATEKVKQVARTLYDAALAPRISA